jgi:hypothetical protein
MVLYDVCILWSKSSASSGVHLFDTFLFFRLWRMDSDSDYEHASVDPYRYDPPWEEHHANAVDVQGIMSQYS